jgi:PII-like signaling protein
VVKPSEESAKTSANPVTPSLRSEGKAKLMRIFVGENDKWHDMPLYRALLESMRANDIAGATVYQGILGYGANRRIHKETTLNLSHDRPMMLSVVDSEEKLRAFFPILDSMVEQGLVVLSDADVIRYTHSLTNPEKKKEPQK